MSCSVLAKHATAPAPEEHIEEYLESLGLFEEEGSYPVKVSWIARSLHVAQPSVVQMLRKLDSLGHVKYRQGAGVQLTERGRKVAKRIMRNHRLMEVFFARTIGGDIEEEFFCGIEHHLTERLTDNVCSWLKHPRKCPHGKPIPEGSCCKNQASA